MQLMDLRIKLFQDGADIDAMIAARARGHVSGFTTNPTLMRKAGINDYKAFALKVASLLSPICQFRSRFSPTISPRWSARRAKSPVGVETPM